MYIQGLDIVWKYFLVFKILLQGDAASHDGCELDIVHQAGAGVASEVFFNDLFANPSNPSDKAGDGCGVEDRLHELVVRYGCAVYLGFIFLRFVPGSLCRLGVWFRVVFVFCLRGQLPPMAIPVHFF